jgi:geranylgeranylglycerol-phosphate geranylgeranyltransferase
MGVRSDLSRVRVIVDASARFVRLFSLGATFLYLLVGAGTGEGRVSAQVVVVSLLIGLAFHVFADVSNDVMDLPIDRTEKRRRASPLVRGVMSPEWALLIALAMLPLMFALVARTASSRAVWPLVAGITLIGLYNVAGKVMPIPFVADVVQGSGWAALVFAGAALAGGATRATAWAAAAVVVYIVMVNGIHGAIRDSENDQRAGAYTTALVLGAGATAEHGVVVPGTVVFVGASLQVAFGLALTGLVVAVPDEVGRPAVAVASACALYALSCAALASAYRARASLRRTMKFGTWHLFLLPAALLAATAALMPGWMVVVACAAFLVPPLAFAWAVRGSSFDVPATSLAGPASRRPSHYRGRLAGLWEMTRPGTPLAGAALVAVGVVLSEEPSALTPALMLATALAIAAANVFNDRCDVAADTVNRPDRPLITGPTTGNDADKFVLTAAILSVLMSAVLGVEACLATSLLLVAGLFYSVALRRVAFAGQLVVAALFAAPVLYGAHLAGGGVGPQHWIAAGLIVTYVFSREVLKSVPDRPGDLAAGYHTPATVLGEPGALTVFRWASAVFCIASLAAYAYADDAWYLVASILFAVVPALRTLYMVKGAPSLQAINAAIAFSGLVFTSGLVPLVLLG